MKAVIVEDELLSSMYLSSLLEIWCTGIEVVATAADCENAIDIIDRYKPDLVFLDIELLNCNGFDVIKLLGPYYPGIIFTTALGDAALKIIKPGGLYFLQKPIDCDDLLNVINKITSQEKALQQQQLKQLLQTLLNDNKPVSIFIETGYGAHFIDLPDIVLIEAMGDTCIFILAGGQRLPVVNHSMKDCESFLADHSFFRMSQKYIINLDFIQSINDTAEPHVVLKNDECIPVSAKRIAALKELGISNGFQ